VSGPIDPAHLAEEWAIDDEILENMADGGDLVVEFVEGSRSELSFEGGR